MSTIIIKAESSKMELIKEFLQSIHVSFQTQEENEKPYNPEFVAKIERSRKQLKEGKITRIKTEDLWK